MEMQNEFRFALVKDQDTAKSELRKHNFQFIIVEFDEKIEVYYRHLYKAEILTLPYDSIQDFETYLVATFIMSPIDFVEEFGYSEDNLHIL